MGKLKGTIKVNRETVPVRFKDNYSFVFSDDIQDWIGSRTDGKKWKEKRGLAKESKKGRCQNL